MKQTDKLKLNLPEYTDAVDIEQLNENFKTLDTKVSEVAENTEAESIVWDYF